MGVPEANHQTICKFERVASQRYLPVWYAIRKLCQSALRDSHQITKSEKDGSTDIIQRTMHGSRGPFPQDADNERESTVERSSLRQASISFLELTFYYCILGFVRQTPGEITYYQKERYQNDKARECHRLFKISEYESQKNINPDRAAGTCRWALEHPRFREWYDNLYDDLLWISADPGCGKSVLSKSLIDRDLSKSQVHTVCYFFFKDNKSQDVLAIALCALIHQLFSSKPELVSYAIPS